ncbi:MAG: metal-dependent hydrolase, partial [Thermodesulfobacteriota bacterium]|nr:metal-dependent hydrolase [Thermodesulfobacteriota bacterium]
MADFKTHLSGGIVTGLGIATISFFTKELNITQVFSLFIMGTVGGILPDIDSDSGKPLSFLFGILSVLLPALLLTKINRHGGLSPEFLVSYFVIAYFIINRVICEIIKKLTVHRGIMHSIPFAVLSSEISYLLFISSGRTMSKAGRSLIIQLT